MCLDSEKVNIIITFFQLVFENNIRLVSENMKRVLIFIIRIGKILFGYKRENN
jgi:hypothetical protein